MLSEPIIGPSLPKRARRISSTARQFFNPLERRYYSIEAPDFAGSVCHASVRDWLLLSVCRRTAAERRWELFFLNPFTKARFDLPNVEADSPAPFDLATCSLPPTSSDCMVLLTKNGMEEFKTTVLKVLQHEHQRPFSLYTHPNTRPLEILDSVYLEGHFYLYGLAWRGCVLSFDPNNGSIKHLIDVFGLGVPMSIHLVESLGHIFAIARGDSSNIIREPLSGGWCHVLQLDLINKTVTEASEVINGQMFFVAAGTSMSIKDPTGVHGASIYFAKFGTFGGGMCEFPVGNIVRRVSCLDNGIYELPEKRVNLWPIVLSDDGLFVDEVGRLFYFRVPPIHLFVDHMGEWCATGGNEEIWIQTPPC